MKLRRWRRPGYEAEQLGMFWVVIATALSLLATPPVAPLAPEGQTAGRLGGLCLVQPRLLSNL